MCEKLLFAFNVGWKFWQNADVVPGLKAQNEMFILEAFNRETKKGAEKHIIYVDKHV